VFFYDIQGTKVVSEKGIMQCL